MGREDFSAGTVFCSTHCPCPHTPGYRMGQKHLGTREWEEWGWGKGSPYKLKVGKLGV